MASVGLMLAEYACLWWMVERDFAWRAKEVIYCAKLLSAGQLARAWCGIPGRGRRDPL